MTTTVFNYHVVIEDHPSFDVIADQRDIALFEQQPFGLPFYQISLRPFTFARFISWSAGKRRKLHALSWEEFEERCIEVESLDEEEEAPEADPGNPAASAGS